MLCFVVVMQSFIMNSHEVFIHIHQGCFAGTGAIVRLPQYQWSKPDGYGKISQCITTTKHSKAKTVCIFLGIQSTSITVGYHQQYHYLAKFHSGSSQSVVKHPQDLQVLCKLIQEMTFQGTGNTSCHLRCQDLEKNLFTYSQIYSK